MDINFLKLVFLRINFKVSKLRTNEFELVLIEIVNIGGEVEHDTMKIIQAYKQLANFLGIYDDQTPLDSNFSKYIDIIERNDIVFAVNSKPK